MTELQARNATWLRQALLLVNRLDDAAFQNPTFRLGGHLRHIIEFFECFLDGLPQAYVDYDARRRDEAIERSRRAAAARISLLIRRLATEVGGDDVPMLVRGEDTSLELRSSVGRELQSLSSHTVHHFALIAMALRSRGIAVDDEFGVAPSTLRHRKAA
jgi:hypothetical protein